ncbi:MAG: ABC transporter permease [Dehalococcoidales bacterium]|nr:ABC transporter permease [Dehalococcoidales bacterium]
MGNSTSHPSVVAITPSISAPRYSETRRILRVFFGRKLAVIGLAFIVLEIIVAIFAPLIAPYDPIKTDLDSRLLQPSWDHLLGTDSAGRDLFSRVIYGARTSLVIGISAVSISTVVGMTMGICAGYFGGWVYTIIMRLTDALMTFPNLILTYLRIGRRRYEDRNFCTCHRRDCR